MCLVSIPSRGFWFFEDDAAEVLDKWTYDWEFQSPRGDFGFLKLFSRHRHPDAVSSEGIAVLRTPADRATAAFRQRVAASGRIDRFRVQILRSVLHGRSWEEVNALIACLDDAARACVMERMDDLSRLPPEGAIPASSALGHRFASLADSAISGRQASVEPTVSGDAPATALRAHGAGSRRRCLSWWHGVRFRAGVHRSAGCMPHGEGDHAACYGGHRQGALCPIHRATFDRSRTNTTGGHARRCRTGTGG